MKVCRTTQPFNFVPHSAACFGSHELSSGTFLQQFKNTETFFSPLISSQSTRYSISWCAGWLAGWLEV